MSLYVTLTEVVMRGKHVQERSMLEPFYSSVCEKPTNPWLKIGDIVRLNVVL